MKIRSFLSRKKKKIERLNIKKRNYGPEKRLNIPCKKTEYSLVERKRVIEKYSLKFAVTFVIVAEHSYNFCSALHKNLNKIASKTGTNPTDSLHQIAGILTRSRSSVQLDSGSESVQWTKRMNVSTNSIKKWKCSFIKHHQLLRSYSLSHSPPPVIESRFRDRFRTDSLSPIFYTSLSTCFQNQTQR